jgi:hypothetical protein
VQILAEGRVSPHLVQITVFVAGFVTWVCGLLLIGRLTVGVEDVLGADHSVRGFMEDLACALFGSCTEMEATP